MTNTDGTPNYGVVPSPATEAYPDDVMAALLADAELIVARYPRERSALLPLLHLVQSVDGYVSPRGVELCADLLGLTGAEVSGVATFYTQFKRHPNGKYTIGVCTNTLCAIMGGDEHLEVALRADCGEVLGVGGVADLAVHDHDLGAGSQRGHRSAERGPGRDLVAERVGGQGESCGGVGGDRRHARSGSGGGDLQIARPAQGGDGTFGHLRWQCLAVPAVLVFQFGHTLGFDGASQHDARAITVGTGLGQRLVDGGGVVAVDDQRAGAEGLHPGDVALQVPLQLGGSALSQAVDVNNGGEVAELVVAGLVQGFPDRALRGLAVPAQYPHVIGPVSYTHLTLPTNR